MAASSMGWRAQEILSRHVAASTKRNMAVARLRPFSTTSTVLSTSRMIRKQREQTPSPRLEAQKQQMSRGFSSADVSVFLPGTFVLPLPSRLPRHLGTLFPLLKHWIKTSVMDMVQTHLAKFASKPSFFSRPVFKLQNSSVVATAKGLHRSMSEAIASGDRETIIKVCTSNMADRLIASIDARPKGRRYSWELVHYNKRWRYPRIVSQKLVKTEAGLNSPMVRQVVVRICSRQRRVEIDDSPAGRGRVVPGSEKEVDLVENITLSAVVDGRTWKQGEWRITGTIKDTELKSFVEEMKFMKKVEQGELGKYKPS